MPEIGDRQVVDGVVEVWDGKVWVPYGRENEPLTVVEPD